MIPIIGELPLFLPLRKTILFTRFCMLVIPTDRMHCSRLLITIRTSIIKMPNLLSVTNSRSLCVMNVLTLFLKLRAPSILFWLLLLGPLLLNRAFRFLSLSRLLFLLLLLALKEANPLGFTIL